MSVGTYWIKCAPGSISYCAGKYGQVDVGGSIPDKNVEACLSTSIDQRKADRVVYRIEANECIREPFGILSCCEPKRNLVAFAHKPCRTLSSTLFPEDSPFED